MSAPRIYLAGPDVFRENPVAEGARLKALCAAHGLEGVYPLDQTLAPGLSGPELACAIAAGNMAFIRGCAGVLANLSPFRGPSADAGTVFEVGFAVALGRPVAGWSAHRRLYAERVGGAGPRDADGMEIENFGMADNLMIVAPLLHPPLDATPEAALARLAKILRQ